jgi:hypothetical protein
MYTVNYQKNLCQIGMVQNKIKNIEIRVRNYGN